MIHAATCPACGDTHQASEDLTQMIARCSLCDARIVYGELAPRIVVEPGTFANGMPAMLIRVQDAKTKDAVHEMKIDPHHAFLLAQAIIGMVRP
jgi:hypothetical protein